MLYLGVALSKIEGREGDAIMMLFHGITLRTDHQPNDYDNVWAKAALARVFRRISPVAEEGLTFARRVEEEVV